MNQPSIYTLQDHQIDLNLIADEAKIVVRELRRAGFSAYLVGGSVRDLCLGKKPKDFDVATSAHPEQIKPLFRHCLLIGRRFRLAHVRFKRMTIEVATFRSGDNQSDDLIIHDNTWGTPEEDALRRDFTCNGLFYDIEDQTIIDYVEGFKDLQSRTLRTIGDPHLRFRQDPVRMIRLLKFQARYPEISIDPLTLEALQACRLEITKSSPARLLEELLRMLESGHAASFFRLMSSHGLLEPLMPHLNQKLQAKLYRLFEYLEACDQYHHHNQQSHLSRDVLFASVVYSLIEPSIYKIQEQRGEWPKSHELAAMAYDEIDAMTGALRHLPKRMKSCIGSMIGLQARLNPTNERGQSKRRFKTLRHPDFSQALVLFELRSFLEASLQTQAQLWRTWYQEHLASHYHVHEIHADNADGLMDETCPIQDAEPSATRKRRPRSRRHRVRHMEISANEAIDSAKPSSSPVPMRSLLPPPNRLVSAKSHDHAES